MFKKSLMALTLMALPFTAFANWSAGAGYANLSDSDDGDSISLGVIYGSVAYEFAKEGSRFSFMPELRLGRSEERRVGKECRSRWSPYH